jgi:hypothetical protein
MHLITGHTTTSLTLFILPTVLNVSKNALKKCQFIKFLTTAAYFVLLSLKLGIKRIRLVDWFVH